MKEQAQKYITEVLMLLNEELPSKAPHKFTFESGRLHLWLFIGEKCQSIVFDESYTTETPSEFVENIKMMLSEAGYNI